MITNPLFNPQNLKRQSPAGMPASLAYALMPTDNFAQKRSDAAAMIQYQAMLSGLAEKAVVEKEKALTDVNESLSLISKQNILAPDMRRMQSMADRWRTETENEIKDVYGGDIIRWKRERQGYLAKKWDNELKTSPDFTTALQNKTFYAEASDARSKGKLILGNWDQSYSDYVNGKTNVLNYKGAYDAPKEVFDYFDKTTHATNPYGVKGKPVEVSQSDLAAHLLSQGMSGEQAKDYMEKIGYRGGRAWKMESEKPWDASKEAFDRNLDTKKYGLSVRSQSEQERHNRATEANQKAEKQGQGPTLSAPDLILNGYQYGPVKNEVVNGRQWVTTEGFTGNMGASVQSLAGISPVSSYITDKKEKKDSDGKLIDEPEYYNKYYGSTVKEVYTPDLKRHIVAKPGDPMRFKSVDPSRVYYDPAPQPDGSHRAFIRATAYMSVNNGKVREQEVMVPLSNTPAAVAGLNDQFGINDTRSEAAQFDSYYQRSQQSAQQQQDRRRRANEIISSLPLDDDRK